MDELKSDNWSQSKTMGDPDDRTIWDALLKQAEANLKQAEANLATSSAIHFQTQRMVSKEGAADMENHGTSLMATQRPEPPSLGKSSSKPRVCGRANSNLAALVQGPTKKGKAFSKMVESMESEELCRRFRHQSPVAPLGRSAGVPLSSSCSQPAARQAYKPSVEQKLAEGRVIHIHKHLEQALSNQMRGKRHKHEQNPDQQA